ncbi:MAG: ATP-dependent DNA helicase RecG [Alphaproteobacteria bacterium]|nr:ATP-dependent DNA helicase RecG [Alphaproteobacteria bacterium]
MRPQILFPLFASVRSLPGVGPKLERLLARLSCERVVDLLWLKPSGLIDRRARPAIAVAAEGQIATIEAKVEIHYPPRSPRRPYKVLLSDASGRLLLVFFRGEEAYLKGVLPLGETRIVSGRIEIFNDQRQMTHPDYILKPEDFAGLPLLEPVYPLTEGLTPKVLARIVHAALDHAPELPEWQDRPWLEKQHWPTWREAVRALHAPQSPAAIDPEAPERMRLAYDELLSNQLALLLIRTRMKRQRGRALVSEGILRKKALAALPFALTVGQRQALSEIDADMQAPARMMRLLQGDVGSGKTVIAFLALLAAVEAGAQGAMMAPTEILTRQHAGALEPLCRSVGLRMAVLTGREKGKPREAVLSALARGEIDILIGTHALFSEDVTFKDLGLAVIDEQHRFGVHQRLALQAKNGIPVDVLVMTATPIPRTLALTAYGDMDVSRLIEKPAGRMPVATRVLAQSRIDEVIAGLEREIAHGGRAYWVCPLVEESEAVDWAAAEARYRELHDHFGAHVGLVHGRMKGAEKDEVMARFKDGALKVLVSTTVIEVGVDVPEATVMIIDEAERFGLAQLHQLRGRVGRGTRPGTCILLYRPPLSDTGRRRLQVMRETDDGFKIAEEDLRLRGSGELLGTRQSGLPEFRLADLDFHGELLLAARDDAAMIVARDEGLLTPRGEALRTLLYLFGRDEAVRYLRSG